MKRVVFQQYFTDSPKLVKFMQSKLSLEKGGWLLEPAAGHGALLDGVQNYGNVRVIAYDIDAECANHLAHRYPSIEVHSNDFLYSQEDKKFNFILANPPYSSKLSAEERKELKAMYPCSMPKEVYSTFLLKSLDLLENEGELCFIIPATFLYSHTLEKLRGVIISNFSLESVDVIPSRLFPGISFGYADLCIIKIVNTCKLSQSIKFKYARNLDELFSKEYTTVPKESLLDVYYSQKHSCAASPHIKVSNSQCVSDIASTATGFYSGDDKRWYKVSGCNQKYQKTYPIIRDTEIFTGRVSREIIDGIKDSDPHYIPVLKGGGWQYKKPTQWYTDWSESAVSLYKEERKARFQNADKYFLMGIGVPMVKSKLMCASLIEGALFDQSIVGIFPRDASLTYYLLAFFNSQVCHELISRINPSANNSAKYIQKIPFISPSSYELEYVTDVTSSLVSNGFCKERHLELQNFFIKKYTSLV